MAAMAENRVIGAGGKLPWHLPEELKFVKATTLGGALVMGRRTYESVGRPMPGRDNIVLTRSLTAIPGCTVLPDLEAVKAYATDRTIWIFGGAGVYEQAMPHVGELYLTIVKGHYAGDTFFPAFEAGFHAPEVIRETPDFTIKVYRNMRFF